MSQARPLPNRDLIRGAGSSRRIGPVRGLAEVAPQRMRAEKNPSTVYWQRYRITLSGCVYGDEAAAADRGRE